ncbi:hypothetical protein VIBNIAM115_580004 [Vibrio nigripulchritudo AM115]|nr:hypothetical protein VIBNIAM115_580004 [Vibrio nigripulchritudo AM115]
MSGSVNLTAIHLQSQNGLQSEYAKFDLGNNTIYFQYVNNHSALNKPPKNV